ncbi:MAG TPA: hypothetical protein VHM19_06820 [Polyangiales bacterium]|nr:hypothetical protein [Polyangiales bacterium]
MTPFSCGRDWRIANGLARRNESGQFNGKCRGCEHGDERSSKFPNAPGLFEHELAARPAHLLEQKPCGRCGELFAVTPGSHRKYCDRCNAVAAQRLEDKPAPATPAPVETSATPDTPPQQLAADERACRTCGEVFVSKRGAELCAVCERVAKRPVVATPELDRVLSEAEQSDAPSDPPAPEPEETSMRKSTCKLCESEFKVKSKTGKLPSTCPKCKEEKGGKAPKRARAEPAPRRARETPKVGDAGELGPELLALLQRHGVAPIVDEACTLTSDEGGHTLTVTDEQLVIVRVREWTQVRVERLED